MIQSGEQIYTFAQQPLAMNRSNLREITEEEWQTRTDAALSWVRRSISVTRDQGSAHSWSPFFGWAKAYPETTGYLVETLLAYASVKEDESLRDLALGCASWLDTIQLPSGAFPGLLAGNTKPSVFNTSQILFAAPHIKGANRAVDWLLSVLESDGAWRAHAFVPGFVPSYYTRAVWGVLYANKFIQKPEIEDLMRQSLHFYAARFLPNQALESWGFRAGEAAFTHTLAYALEGFLECAQLLNEPVILDQTICALERLLMEREQVGGRTAGRYDARWRGDYSFRCITGNCQLSILYHKAWTLTGEPKFKAASHSFLTEIIGFQKLGANKNTFGALPGSAPFWGPYLPFRYPNWTAKFFLDAMLVWGCA